MTHVDLTTVPGQAHPSTDGRTATLAAKNRSRHGRVRSWTRSALRDLVYDAAVGVWAVVAFTVLVTGVAVTSSLLVLVIGVFVWVGFAHIVRWMTSVDRALAGWRLQKRVSALYQRPTAPGVAPYIKALSSDPQTWRDLVWLAVTSIVGFTFGLAMITGAGLVGTYVSMPLWYWAVSHPRTEYGITNLGLFNVDTLGEAGIAAAIGVTLIPFVLLLARWCAAAHSGLAVRLLGQGTQQS